MIRSLRDYLHRRVARVIFKNPALAAHSLRFAGTVAGRIDSYEKGRIRGWIYDANRPNQSVKLHILVENSSDQRLIASLYRKDIAEIANNEGMNGFEIDISRHFRSGATALKLEIIIDKKQSYMLGPVLIVENAHSAIENGQQSLAGSSGADLQHLFQHVTATFEETRARLDHMIGLLTGSLDEMPTQLLADRPSSVRDYQTKKAQLTSAIFGIGEFRSGPIDQKIEENLMAARIEAHLRDATRIY